MITETIISIFKYISIFCEIIFMLDFFNRISKKLRGYFLPVLSLFPFVCILMGLKINGEFWDHTWVLFPTAFLYIWYALKDRFALSSFLAITYITGIMTQRYIFSISMHALLDPLGIFTEEQMTLLIFTIVCVGIFALSRFLLLIGQKSSSLFPGYYWWVFMALQIFIFLLLKALEGVLVSEYSPTLLMLAGTIYAFILASAYLFSRITQDFSHILDQSLYEQQSSIQAGHQAEMQELYEELRKLRHELKNHFFYLENLLDGQEYQEASDYLKQISQTPQNLKHFVDTGNPSINAILNSKMYLADSKGILLTVTGALPPNLPFHSGDLFGLLSNLLDNAIENTDSQNPLIQVKTEIVKSYFSVVVHNTVNAPVLPENPLLHTTKAEIRAHGYGLKIVRSITEKYNGMMNFWEDETGFTMSVMLSLSQADEAAGR